MTGTPIENRKTGKLAWFIDLVLIPLLLVLFLYYPGYHHGALLPWDEGQHLACIQGLLQGKVIYRDIYDISGPLPELIPYWMMKVLGPDIAVLRAFYYYGIFLSLFIIYLAARKLIRRRLGVLFTIILCIEYAVIRMPTFWTSRWGGLRIGVAFLVLLALWRYIDSKNKLWLFASGIASAIALLYSPEMGIISIIISIVVAAIERKQPAEGAPRNTSLGSSTLLRVAAGFAVGVAPWLVYCVATGALWDYVKLSFYDIPFRLTTALPYGHELFLFASGFSFWKWLVLFWASKTGQFFVAIAIVLFELILLVRIGIRKEWTGDSTRRLTLLILGSYLLMLATRSIHFWSPQLSYATPPVLLLFGYHFLHGCERMVEKFFSASVGTARQTVLVAAPMVLIASMILFKNIWMNNFVPYHLINPRPATPGSVLLDLPRSKRILTKADEAKMLSEITHFITRNTTPSDSLFAFPLDGRFYFLADRSNPTRFDIAINTAIDPEYEDEAIRDLERWPPPYVLYDKNALRLGGNNPIPNEERVPRLAEYIFSHYQPHFELSGMVVMSRTKESTRVED